MQIRHWRVRATLMWALLALVFALWEYALPLVDEGDDGPEHSLNRPQMATRLRHEDSLRR